MIGQAVVPPKPAKPGDYDEDEPTKATPEQAAPAWAPAVAPTPTPRPPAATPTPAPRPPAATPAPQMAAPSQVRRATPPAGVPLPSPADVARRSQPQPAQTPPPAVARPAPARPAPAPARPPVDPLMQTGFAEPMPQQPAPPLRPVTPPPVMPVGTQGADPASFRTELPQRDDDEIDQALDLLGGPVTGMDRTGYAEPAPAPTPARSAPVVRRGTGQSSAQKTPPPELAAPRPTGLEETGYDSVAPVTPASRTGGDMRTPPTGPRKPGAVSAGANLAPGTRIHQYELIRELGRGGMGCVYVARDTKLGRRVAMKFLLHASKGVADRFLVEARATARCSHENIVIIHEVDEYEDAPYMVLEFLEGEMLRGMMGSRLAPSRAIELILPVARALARAHEFDIVHRDLKPENIFVTSGGTIKVLDFGIAKALGKGEARTPAAALDPMTLGDISLTKEGAMVGTMPYMSPEQFGMDTVDHRTDLWAVGIMLWEMLAARHPLEPLTPPTLITNAANLDAPMPPIRSVAPDVPEMLARIVDGCLQKKKDDRIGSAAELVGLLEALLPGRRGRQLAEEESPYPGLTAFQEADADRFFGRARDVTRMTARIREHPLTGVVGPSGVGKSSFIRAGVGPALKASGEHWSVVTLRPGRSPLVALASVMQDLTTRSGTHLKAQATDHDEILHRLRTEPGYLGAQLRARARQTQGHILLFVDQFEELYTLVPDAEERKAFTAALAGVADDTATPLRVVVSMRADFLDRVAEDQRFMEELGRGLVFLAPPDRAGLREALVQPVEMVDFRFESSAMVEDMLNALEGTPGALPLLQFAAAKLWDARDRDRRVLTAASYEAIGGISGALATHADDVLAGMDPAAQKLTRQIFQRLVTPERTRAIVEVADLHALVADKAEVTRVLDQLVAARLLVVQTRGDAGGGSVEIVHESLIERWPTLQRWLDEDQEDAAFVSQLRTAAKQWESKGKPSGLLWRGEAMEEARHWHKRRPRELPAREQQFLDAVFALATRGKRLRRVALVVAFTIMGAVTAGAVVALLWIRSAEREATEQKEVAEQREQDARSAEKQARDALAAAEEKERQRLAAEAGKTEAERAKELEEQKKRAAEAEVVKKGEQLAQSYDDLKDALAKAEKEKDRAEAASKDAKKAAAEAEREKERAEDVSKKLAEKNKALEEKLKKLSTTLK